MNLPINLSQGYAETNVEDRNFHQIEYRAWSERASYYDAIFAAISTQAIDPILEALEPVQDKRHLDVACGTGHLVAAATRRGAISEGVDFVHAMVAAARENYAMELFQAADAMDLPYEDETFDLVTCSFGLNNMADPQRAVAEAFRVLKAGGHLAFTLWYGAEDGNTSQAIIKGAIERHATVDSKLPESWTQLRNPDEQTCAALARQAGFGSPVFKHLPIVQRAKSAQEMIEKFMKLSLRTRLVIERQPAAVQELIFQQIQSEVETHRTNGFIPLDWPALLTVVQKPKFEGRTKSSSQIETKYTLFNSLEEMLVPATLSELLSQPVTHVNLQPAEDLGGLAGGRLSHINTDIGRFVLKQMSHASDWLMYASNDLQCRSVTLWQYGLLDELQPHLAHKIIACARDGAGWAILMDDLTEGLFGGWDNQTSLKRLKVFLDRMAKSHATFWNDPRLHDSRLGLCDSAMRLDVTSLTLAQNHPGDQRGVLPEWVREGWTIMESSLDKDVFVQLNQLRNDPQPLLDAMERYPYTLVHGDYRAANLAYLKPDQAVAFDWQMAARSLMTTDLVWFTSQWNYVLDEMGKTKLQGYYRGRLETYLGRRFEDTVWQAMVELGNLYNVIFNTCFVAYWHKHTDDSKLRQFLGMRLMQLNQQVRDGMRWL